ncbi:hypothetical protein Tco_0669196 [Tanacetum coccineum]
MPALGVLRLSLAKNTTYNIVKEKTAYNLIKALSNMYEKPSASNKVCLIRVLINAKMKERGSDEDHVNHFNSILARLVSIEIKFHDELQALLKFHDELQALLLLSSLSRASQALLRQLVVQPGLLNLRRNQRRKVSSKPVASKDKEVNMAVGDSDDALMYCIENMIEARIMDSGASFHASHFKEELERATKIHETALDIAGLGDIVFKTFFGTSWALKDVSLVVAHGNKCESLYMVEVHSNEINTTIYGRGSATLWHQRVGHMSEKGAALLGKQKMADCATMLPLFKIAVGKYAFC